MIDRILQKSKVSIIEKGVIRNAYNILYEQQDDIFDVLTTDFPVVHHDAMRSITTFMAFYVQYAQMSPTYGKKSLFDFIDARLLETFDGFKYGGDLIGSILYNTLRECETTFILHFLGDYSKVVCSLSDNALETLLSIFEGCFIMDTPFSALLDIEYFIESSGWSGWTIEDAVLIGEPFLAQIDGFENCKQWSEEAIRKHFKL